LFSINIIHFISLTHHENTIAAMFCRLVYFLSSRLANIIQLLYFHIMINGSLKKISTKFRQVLKQCSVFYLRFVSVDILSIEICGHCNASSLLCPIIKCHLFVSYVFRLQYPRVLHCRVVAIEKLKTFVALERKNLP
jgi:hypothetical protein